MSPAAPTSSHTTSDAQDVIIVGGGLAGLSLAVALGQNGLKTAVIDTEDPGTTTNQAFDGRSFAVAYGSAVMLQTLGVWERLEADVQPIEDILITDGSVRSRFREGGASPFFLHFDRRELEAEDAGAALGYTALGYMVEARHARAALYQVIDTLDAVELIAPAKTKDVIFHDNTVEVTLEDGRHLWAALCVAADGRASPLRQQVGIQTVGWGYDQHGIVTTVEHAIPHQGIAQEYFLPAGPFAILPLKGDRSSLVWTEGSSKVRALMNLDDPSFMDELTRRFGDYLGDLKIVSPRQAFPLSLQIAREFIAPRFALIGDAAHGIHPISGQGWNLGLKDVAVLSEVLVEAHRLGLDIGALHLLERYQQWRRFDTMALAVITDGMNKLFANDFPPLKLARDLGMQAVNYMGPLKRVFIRHAAGVMGDLPKLFRGETL